MKYATTPIKKWTPEMKIHRLFYYESNEAGRMTLVSEESYSFEIDARRIFADAVKASTNCANDTKIEWFNKNTKMGSFTIPALVY